ncbi:Dual oxidase [Halotydeus destructor]|nr:Dual oxidase [Halotydeus destructor]
MAPGVRVSPDAMVNQSTSRHRSRKGSSQKCNSQSVTDAQYHSGDNDDTLSSAILNHRQSHVTSCGTLSLSPWRPITMALQLLVICNFILFPVEGVNANQSKKQFKAEMQRYDGWYNNLAHPAWGSIESQLTRKAVSSYSDGVYMMAGMDRPSPRTLSQHIMKGDDGIPSARNLTTLFAFFGQMVSLEILMASESGCPIEMHKIDIEKCDPMFDKGCQGNRKMPFHRAAYDPSTGQSPNLPREQLNHVSSWIDGSFVYSTSETWLNSMRSFKDGKFRTSDTSDTFPPKNRDRAPLLNVAPAHLHKMPSPERMFLLGDPRTNQNPPILALGILMFRWHNTLADRVRVEFPDWSDEDIFQRARRLVIASLQNIILYEYLPTLLGDDDPVGPYVGYKPDVHPGISHVFQSAAFRFGHTMIPPGLYRRDATCDFKTTPKGYPGIRMCASWWAAEEILPKLGVEELLMGITSQIAEREDAILCSDVRDKLFGPMDFSRRDLAALNIMRGRDNGLPDYNTVRKVFGLEPITDWANINPEMYKTNPEMFMKLEKEYKTLDNVDLYVAGMLEARTSEGRPGPLFRRIIKEQFERIRDSDRFWFENAGNDLFTPEEVAAIRNISLWDILVNATDIPGSAVQKSVFKFEVGDPCPQPRQLDSSQLEPCMILPSWNYFHGSEVPYILVCTLLCFIPIVVALIGYGVIKLQSKRKQTMKAIKKDNNNGNKKDYDKLYVREWLHHNYKRYVKVKIGPGEILSTINRKGEVLRRIDFSKVDTVVIEVTQDSRRPMALIRSPLDHDLVLQFDSNAARKKFLSMLEAFLANIKKTLEMIHTYKDVMLDNAETKEKRQKKLDKFFREAYALTFGLPQDEMKARKKMEEELPNDVYMVMRTSLSRQEFAEALGMRADSLFVTQMFNVCDKDNDGRISFQEFLDTVVLFSRGKSEDKLRIIFDMCDHERTGIIAKGELTNMLRSLVDIAKTNSLDADQADDMVKGMYASVGLQDKERLTYDDFKKMMSEYKGDAIAIGLDLKGQGLNYLDTSSGNVARMTSFQLNTQHEPKPSYIRQQWNGIMSYLEENRQHIVYMFIFYAICFVLFFERFITYSYLSEHTDLRHVMGYGIAITRGSAASLSFCYSLLLLTMCRNLDNQGPRDVHTPVYSS